MKLASALSASILAASLVSVSAIWPGVFGFVPNWNTAVHAADDQGFGRLDPTPPSGITVDEIIKKFGDAKASSIRRVRITSFASP